MAAGLLERSHMMVDAQQPQNWVLKFLETQEEGGSVICQTTLNNGIQLIHHATLSSLFYT